MKKVRREAQPRFTVKTSNSARTFTMMTFPTNCLRRPIVVPVLFRPFLRQTLASALARMDLTTATSKGRSERLGTCDYRFEASLKEILKSPISMLWISGALVSVDKSRGFDTTARRYLHKPRCIGPLRLLHGTIARTSAFSPGVYSQGLEV